MQASRTPHTHFMMAPVICCISLLHADEKGNHALLLLWKSIFHPYLSPVPTRTQISSEFLTCLASPGRTHTSQSTQRNVAAPQGRPSPEVDEKFHQVFSPSSFFFAETAMTVTDHDCDRGSPTWIQSSNMTVTVTVTVTVTLTVNVTLTMTLTVTVAVTVTVTHLHGFTTQNGPLKHLAYVTTPLQPLRLSDSMPAQCTCSIMFHCMYVCMYICMYAAFIR